MIETDFEIIILIFSAVFSKLNKISKFAKKLNLMQKFSTFHLFKNFAKNYISKFYVDSFFSYNRTFHFFIANDRFLNHEKCFYFQNDSNILC